MQPNITLLSAPTNTSTLRIQRKTSLDTFGGFAITQEAQTVLFEWLEGVDMVYYLTPGHPSCYQGNGISQRGDSSRLNKGSKNMLCSSVAHLSLLFPQVLVSTMNQTYVWLHGSSFLGQHLCDRVTLGLFRHPKKEMMLQRKYTSTRLDGCDNGSGKHSVLPRNSVENRRFSDPCFVHNGVAGIEEHEVRPVNSLMLDSSIGNEVGDSVAGNLRLPSPSTVMFRLR